MKKKHLTYHNHSGFKLPETYFEDFESRFFVKLEAEKSFGEKIASGYKIPENYFEEFSVPLSKNPGPKVIPIFGRKNMWYAASIAAVLVLIFSVFTKNQSPKAMFPTVDQASIESYFENSQMELSTLQEFEENVELSEPEFSTINEELLLDYLMDARSELSFAN